MLALFFVLATGSMFFMTGMLLDNIIVAGASFFFAFCYFCIFVAGFFQKNGR